MFSSPQKTADFVMTESKDDKKISCADINANIPLMVLGDVLVEYLKRSISHNPDLFTENENHISLQTLLALSLTCKSWNRKFGNTLIWFMIARRLCTGNTEAGIQLLNCTPQTYLLSGVNAQEIKPYVMKCLKVYFQQKHIVLYRDENPLVYIVRPPEHYFHVEAVGSGAVVGVVVGAGGGCVANCFIGPQNLPIVTGLLKVGGLCAVGSFAGLLTGAGLAWGTCAVIGCALVRSNQRIEMHNQLLNDMATYHTMLQSSAYGNPLKLNDGAKFAIDSICVSKLSLLKAVPPTTMTMSDEALPAVHRIYTNGL